MTGELLIEDPKFLVLALVGLMIVGISKGGFGGSLGVIGVPLLAIVIPVQQAAAIMLPCLIVMDFTGLHGWRGRWCWEQLRRLLPSAGLGILAGVFSFHLLSDDALRIMIGCMGLVFGLQWWIQHLGIFRGRDQRVTSVWHSVLWGSVSGFTSFSVHAGGPPLQIALLPQRLSPQAYTATAVVFFTFVNLAKVFPYYWLGQFTQNILWTALVLAPIGPFAVWLGIYLNQRTSPLWFYRVCYFGLVISSIRLLYVGFSS